MAAKKTQPLDVTLALAHAPQPVFADRDLMFQGDKIYMMHFGKVPNILKLSFSGEELNLDGIDRKRLGSLGINCRYFHKIDCITLKTADGSVKNVYKDDESEILVVTSSMVIELFCGQMLVYHDLEPELAREYFMLIAPELPRYVSSPEESEINLVIMRGGMFFTTASKLNAPEIDINVHYNDDFAPVYKDIVNFLEGRQSGLAILHGEKGTGKTNMIRHLCHMYPQKYIIITNSVASYLAAPEFVSFLLDNQNSIFILEDCEQILMERSENTFGSAIANILNMSDGLFSDIFNIKFICTFNANIDCIDPALLRKGRCYANYEFKALAKDKATALLHTLGHDVEAPGPMTLADIYNFKLTDYGQKKVRRIGF